MSDDNDKLGPPPLDPLSNAAWARIERRVFDRLDAGEETPIVAPPSRKWPWLAVPLVVAAAAAAAVVVMRSPSPTSHVVAGNTVVQPADEPSRVVTGDTSSTVSFGDALLTLAPRAAIVMDHEGDAPSVMLDRGSTTFEVAPRNGRPAFVVRAADVVVRVVGTRFTVARSDERVDVSVDHGIVDVQFKAQITRVGAGQHWSSDAPTKTASIEPAAPTTPPPTEIAPAPTESTTPPEPIPGTTEKTPTEIQKQLSGDSKPSDERDRFEHFSAIEAKEPNAALAGYLEISKGHSSWAPVALFAAGRLAADKKDPRARELLSIYLKRFPSGANAADARDLLDHLGAH